MTAIWTTQNKSSASSFTNQSKASSSWATPVKGGQGWKYDQAGINYDSVTEESSGNVVLYDSLGYAPNWVNQPKS